MTEPRKTTVDCYDRLSGERFRVDADDAERQIHAYIRAGIDSDSGSVAYEVETDDDCTYTGVVDPEDN
jgi:hypothetical protein